MVGRSATRLIRDMHLEVGQLTKVYPGNRGLLPTSFTVNRGELIAIVGHNGAGKSTLLKLLSSWLVPDGGTACIEGTPLQQRTKMVRLVGFVPETPSLYDLFSVEYNLALFARLFGSKAERIEEILTEFNLLSYRRNAVRTLSKGLKQRVSIGRSLLANPPVLLLDEPTSGLDFEMTAEMYRLIRRIHALGKTILFTSHRPEEVKSLATRILVLHEGSLVFDGPPAAYFESGFYEELYA